MLKIDVFLKELSTLSIEQSIYDDNSLTDVGEYSPRFLLGTVFPKNQEEVLAIIRLANYFLIPLFPFSIGKNWGLGSKMSSQLKCLNVDLSKMRRILELDIIKGYVIIEPGVTQLQLHEELKDSSFLLNVTASSAHSSIIGNILERGVGYHRQRTKDLLGLEIILGNETVIKSGSFWSSNSPQFHYSEGIGPSLNSIFLQSNFGIVTSAAVSLIPKPEHIELFNLQFSLREFKIVFSILKRQFNNKLYNCILKILNPDSENFILVGAICGYLDLVNQIKKRLMKDFGNIGKLSFFNSKEMHFDKVNINHLNLYKGIPNSDTIKKYILDPTSGESLDDQSYIGIRLILPIVPFSHQSIIKVFRILNSSPHKNYVFINKTINIISGTAISFVIYLKFVRNITSITYANEVQDYLLKELGLEGFFSYRLDIDHMNQLAVLNSSNYLNNLIKIKKVLDPNGIIAPGRYIPTTMS